MSWLSDLFDSMLLKRVVGLAVRRLIDFAAGALLTISCFGTDICGSFASWISQNATQLEVFLISLVMGAISAAWSFSQKKSDIKEIRRQEKLRIYDKQIWDSRKR